MSGVRTSSSVSVVRLPFFIFDDARSAGRQSATAAAMITASAPSHSASTASLISSALPTRTTLAPTGACSAFGAATITVSAPRSMAASAIA